jgi:hypothetical protein
LPAINSRPFFGVKNDVDFLQKNREATKFLTKSQSQARIIESTDPFTQRRPPNAFPKLS